MRKTRLALWLMIGILGGFVASSPAEEKPASDPLLAILAQQFRTMLNANAVLGQPLDFDGTKVIPVVRMKFKVSARRDAGQRENDEDDEDDEDQTAGNVLSVESSIVSQGLLVVTKDGEVKILELHTPRRSAVPKGPPPPPKP